MKAIMYHYVRPDSGEFPYFRHLHVDDFVAQLEHLGNELGFVSKDDFARSFSSPDDLPSGVVLTFDDGFKDHWRYVLPELLRRGLWGIFYVPTLPYKAGKFVDVHRVHLLLGKYGGAEVADALRATIVDDMLSHAHIAEFHSETYVRQNNSSSV